MISSNDAIRLGRALLGTPYAELDCINYLKRIIRTAPGGVPKYTTAGTNSLWRSFGSAKKYRDLTWRQEGISGARAGMLAFKRTGGDVHHVGLVTGEGTVLHASSEQGRAVESPLDGRWQMLALHRYIAAALGGQDAAQDGALFAPGARLARVATARDPLRVRSAPVDGEVIGSLPKGALVEVLENGEWMRVKRGSLVGYASGMYLEKV